MYDMISHTTYYAIIQVCYSVFNYIFTTASFGQLCRKIFKVWRPQQKKQGECGMILFYSVAFRKPQVPNLSLQSAWNILYYTYIRSVLAAVKGRQHLAHCSFPTSLAPLLRTHVGLSANEICFGTCIDACARAARWREAVALLFEMPERRLERNTICCNAGIAACQKAARKQFIS